jgi:hypothetical protein
MLRHVILVRTDVSEDLSASIIKMIEALISSDTSVLTRATRRNIPEDGILYRYVFVLCGSVQRIYFGGRRQATSRVGWNAVPGYETGLPFPWGY